MSEREKQILETFEKVIPTMTEVEKARLIGYGEGLAAREDRPKMEEVIKWSENIRLALAGRSDAE